MPEGGQRIYVIEQVGTWGGGGLGGGVGGPILVTGGNVILKSQEKLFIIRKIKVSVFVQNRPNMFG